MLWSLGWKIPRGVFLLAEQIDTEILENQVCVRNIKESRKYTGHSELRSIIYWRRSNVLILSCLDVSLKDTIWGNWIHLVLPSDASYV